MIISYILLSTALAHPSSALPRPEPVSLVGQVRAAAGGGAGRARVLLVTKNAEEFEIHASDRGDAAELERLAGVKVKVRGIKNDPRLPRGRHVMVEGYEIVDVGKGVVPELGTIASLETSQGAKLLFVNEMGQAALLPDGWAKKMSRHVGAKIWMVGQRKGDRLRPKRFAILRAAPTP
jgi:hypothetical protein